MNGIGNDMVKVKKVVAITLCMSFLMGVNVQATGISRETVDYSAVFDADFYYNKYPDVQETVGHVGIYLSADGQTVFDGCQMVSKVNVSDGIQCRVVAQELPECAKTAEPTLEDAYLYCIHRKGGRQ